MLITALGRVTFCLSKLANWMSFPSGGRPLHYWLDVFATSRPSRGGSHEKTATLSYTFMGKQEGHGGVHVWTQGSP